MGTDIMKHPVPSQRGIRYWARQYFRVINPSSVALYQKNMVLLRYFLRFLADRIENLKRVLNLSNNDRNISTCNFMNIWQKWVGMYFWFCRQSTSLHSSWCDIHLFMHCVREIFLDERCTNTHKHSQQDHVDRKLSAHILTTSQDNDQNQCYDTEIQVWNYIVLVLNFQTHFKYSIQVTCKNNQYVNRNLDLLLYIYQTMWCIQRTQIYF